jgi:hypothetical protein
VIDRLESERGLWGTFGADLQPKPIAQGAHKSDLYNALFGLGRAWTSFAIAPSSIDASPNTTGFTMIAMRPGPATNERLPNGAKSWMRDVRACYAIGDPTIYSDCLPTLFDTGASAVTMRIKGGSSLPMQGTEHCGNVLKAGTSFSALTTEKNGKLLARFMSGTTQNWDEVRVETPAPSESPQVNTGLTFYNRDEIAFDAVHGSVGLRPLHPPVHEFEKNCD